MFNYNGPGFAGLYAGDTVEFRVPSDAPHAKRPNYVGQTVEHRTASVLPLLVFADHVQVKYGSFGYTVDASNFIRLVRRGKRHIAADKARINYLRDPL